MWQTTAPPPRPRCGASGAARPSSSRATGTTPGSSSLRWAGGFARPRHAVPDWPPSFGRSAPRSGRSTSCSGVWRYRSDPAGPLRYRRAPDLAAALQAAFGPGPEGAAAMPLREVLGAVGAHQWCVRGVPVPALGATLHPAYGVFAPVRGEYVELVAQALSRSRIPGRAHRLRRRHGHRGPRVAARARWRARGRDRPRAARGRLRPRPRRPLRPVRRHRGRRG